jgi:hypothetical protein
MEVPISLRTDGTAPSDALRIEASPQELRVNAQPVLGLERGRIAASEITPEGAVTKLRAAIQSAPARPRAALTFHGMVGYGTLARTIEALTVAGYRELSVAVRPLTSGAPPNAMSWLALAAPRVVPPGTELVDPASVGGTARRWSEFTQKWEEVYQTCRAGRSIDCDPPPAATPDDGQLMVVLWARGQGMQIRFHRVGAPPPPDPRAVLESQSALVAAVQTGRLREGQQLPPTPVTQGTFTFRADVATTANSAISLLARPVCGALSCLTVVEADEETPVMRVISFVGAMFPNGSATPSLIFRLPRRPD